MHFLYCKLGKLIVPPVNYIPPIKLLSQQALVDVLSYFNRGELDYFQLISKQFNQLINRTFVDYPYRCFYTLDVQLDAARESPPCKVVFAEAKSTILFFSFFECLEIFQDKRNARFKHTKFSYARKLPVYLNDEMDEFVVTFSHLNHLWQGQKLNVFMMPWDRQRAPHFRRIFTNFAAGSCELMIVTPERQDFPLQILFEYPDVKVTNLLKIDAFAPPNNLVSESGALLHYLHRPVSKTLWLTFTKGGDQSFFKQIVTELRKHFQSSNEPCMYTVYLIGLQNARFYSVRPHVIDNEVTGEKFKITKKEGEFNIAYKIVRWKIQKNEPERTRKKSKKNSNVNSDVARSNEPARITSHNLTGEDCQSIRYSFC